MRTKRPLRGMQGTAMAGNINGLPKETARKKTEPGGRRVHGAACEAKKRGRSKVNAE